MEVNLLIIIEFDLEKIKEIIPVKAKESKVTLIRVAAHSKQ